MHGHPRARRRPRLDRGAHGRAGLHPDAPVRGPGGARRPRARRLPGGGLRRRLRPARQVGGRAGRPGPHGRDRGPRLRHRPAGPPRAGGGGPARGHAARARERPRAAPAARRARGPAGRDPGGDRRAAGGGGAADRGPGRLRLDRTVAGAVLGLAGGAPAAGRAVLPAQGADRQRPSLLRGRPGPGAQSQADRADQGGGPGARDRRPPRREPDPGLHPVHGRGDRAAPGPHPSGAGGAEPGLAGVRSPPRRTRTRRRWRSPR